MTRTVLITGGSRGIGYATAELFARHGWQVALCSRSATQAQQAAERIAKLTGAQVTGYGADIGDPASIERLFNALKDQPGRKVIMIYVAGIDAMTPLASADPGRFDIELSTGGNILPALAAYKQVPGMEGAIYYYYEAPDNAVNDWLVEEHMKRFGTPPDFFTAGGMASAMAIVKALETAPDWETETLIETMEGMSFETPKGSMTFRPEDHQALQSMYHFKIKVDDSVKWAIPELVREIKPEEMDIPIGRNNQE